MSEERAFRGICVEGHGITFKNNHFSKKDPNMPNDKKKPAKPAPKPKPSQTQRGGGNGSTNPPPPGGTPK